MTEVAALIQSLLSDQNSVSKNRKTSGTRTDLARQKEKAAGNKFQRPSPEMAPQVVPINRENLQSRPVGIDSRGIGSQ